MPRAFLITHRRYNSEKDGEMRESSPEHKVSLPEIPSTSSNSQNYDDYIEETTSSSDCPDELYNLTKLAEVSLAAASGQLYHHRHLSAVPFAPSGPSGQTVSPSVSPVTVHQKSLASTETGYAHKLFDRDRDRVNVVRSEDCKPLGRATSGSNGDISNLGEGAQHECPDCGKRYSTSSNLARHRQTHRSLADKKARRCPHCDKVYVSMPAYSMHVRTHVQGCRCPYCGKCFSRPWLLQGHIRTHTGEKPFRCSVCQKAFADKSNLRAHVQTHSDTKPHVCGRCGKAFALKSYLYKHEESSCMRGQRSASAELLSPQKQSQPYLSPIKVHHIQNIFQPQVDQPKCNPSPGVVIAAPTPVIVRPNRQFRSTVISPNPERAVLSFVERPTAIISTVAAAGRCCVPLPLPLPLRRGEGERNQDQPMDFSTNKDAYTVGLAIAV